MDWFGAEVGFFIYIHIGGVSPPPPPSIINQCYLPAQDARARQVARALGAALSAYALRARSTRTRPTSSRLRAGQPHHAGALHPLVAGSIPAPAGGCGVGGPKRSAVARTVASRHGASDNARRPKPKPTRKPRPRSGPSTIPSTCRSRRHSGATSCPRGAAGR